MKIAAVTSFSPRGYEVYGKRFLDTFLRHWTLPIHVFTEGQDPPFFSERIYWRDLRADEEHEAFCARYAGPEFNHPTDFNEQSVRFCHKVFAVTHESLSHYDWLLWLDADCITKKDIGERELSLLCPVGKSVTYLGRRGFCRPGQPWYPECGLVGYGGNNGRRVLRQMRKVYTSGELFTLGPHNWHDSYVFAKTASELVPIAEHNDLCAHHRGTVFAPFEHTWLRNFIVHNKGARRKLESYGGLA